MHRGPGETEDLWRDLAGGAVGGVDDERQALELRLDGVEEVAHVARAGVVHHRHATDVDTGRARRRLVHGGGDGVLDDIGQLVPAVGEELDAVVRHREAGDDRRRQELAGGSGVAPDDGHGASPLGALGVAQDTGRGLGQSQREVSSDDVAVGEATDTVGAEESGHG